MTKKELNLILDKHKKWLNNEEGGERANLRGANLRGADLEKANLREADLRLADLRLADLRGANLEKADLRLADLRGADLYWTNLQRADLEDSIPPLKRLKSIFGFEYPIAIIDDVIEVGCQRHDYEEWKSFTQEEIYKMGGNKAIEFYPKLLKILEMEMN
jgi:Pentapeptide repeats (8 copies)